MLPRLVLALSRRRISVAALSLSKENDNDKTKFASHYYEFRMSKDKRLQELLQDPGRFQHVSQREERSIVSADAMMASYLGKYFSVYRGVELMKAPAEMMVLYQLFWHVRPRTVIELGAYAGGSAIWMADMLKLSEVECNIYSVDIDLSLLQPQAKELQPPNVTFIEGNCEKLEAVFSAEFLAKQPHPWVVIEDAHESMEPALEYLHHHLTPGDYIVCEDTTPDAPVVREVGGVFEQYERLGPIKLHAWKKFLAKYEDKYAVDTFFNDYYGYNCTSYWDGFVRRMK